MTFNFVEKVMCIGGNKDTESTFQFYKKGFVLGGNNGSTPSWQDIILSGNTALTLVNAKANGLNYVKLFGACEQRNLPEGYTQIKSLKSDGRQFIDTGFIADSDIVTYKFKLSNFGTASNSSLFGSEKSTSGPYSCVPYRTGEGFYYIYIGNASGGGAIDNTDVEYEIEINNNTITIYRDGSPAAPFSFNGSIKTDLSVYLFANHDDVSRAIQKCDCGYEYFQVYKNGLLELDLIPCRRNSDNILGMFDLVSQTLLTNQGTGTFTAGADVLPSPDTPVDIVSNNGALKYGQYGKNLFDATNITKTSGTIPNAYMVEFTVNGANLPIIELKSGITYTLSFDVETTVFPYGISIGCGNRNYAKDVQQTGTIFTDNGRVSVTFTPTDADLAYGNILAFRAPRYSQLTNFTYSISNIQLERGGTATPYEPYHFGIHTDGTQEIVTVTGKNLIDGENEFGNLDAKGQPVGNMHNYIRTKNFSVIEPNTLYTIKVNNKDIATQSYVLLYDENKNLLVRQSAPQMMSNGYVFTSPANAKYIKVFIYHTVTWKNLFDWQLQLEEGNTATEYEPYFNGGTATAEMLLSVGDYQDEQEVLAGNVTRNIGIKVLNGTENWIKGSTQIANYSFYVDDSSVAILTDRTILSTHFQSSQTLPPASLDGRKNKIWRGTSDVKGTQASICVGYDFDNATVADFKQFLAQQYAQGTPVIVVYPLAEPTTESVAGQALTTQAGTNIVEITQASIDNLALEVSYKGKQ